MPIIYVVGRSLYLATPPDFSSRLERKPIKIGNKIAVVTTLAAICTVAISAIGPNEALAPTMAAGVPTAFPAVEPSDAPTMGFQPMALKSKYPTPPVRSTVSTPSRIPPSPPWIMEEKLMPIPSAKAKTERACHCLCATIQPCYDPDYQ